MSTTEQTTENASPLRCQAPVDDKANEKPTASAERGLAENMLNTLEQIHDVLRGSTIAEEREKDVQSKFWATYKRRTFFRIQKLYRHTGDVVKPRSEFTGRPRKLNLEDVQYLVELVRHRPDWFLDELTGLMLRNRFVATHYTTIHQELYRAGVSLKKLRKMPKSEMKTSVLTICDEWLNTRLMNSASLMRLR
ncbi:hypothetical protein M405DRAFT_838132 [Rhizopogon salebrosus TDB-379]|nr:hypothetical protein M405DRAFT_838132 [Rhizopogon salebrosus TDB-379]